MNSDCRLPRLGEIARPAFRLGLLSSIHQAHPFDFVDEYQRLFEVFAPILRRDAERLRFWEGGRTDRRRKSIQKGDWTPFQHLRDVVPPPTFTFIGFEFQSGRTIERVHDAGPTSFRFQIGDTSRLDATVPVEDFENGTLDIDALKAALLAIPTRSGFSGYGMCLSQDYPGYGPEQGGYSYDVARKYPALDAQYLYPRGWSQGYEDDPARTWILGLNWLTLVGEPFLSRMGGLAAVTRGLPPEITWQTGHDSVLFQLGERPITGQAGVDDDLLPLYFELGKRLKPSGNNTPSLEYPQHVFFTIDKQSSVDWTRRFYDGKWFEKPDVRELGYPVSFEVGEDDAVRITLQTADGYPAEALLAADELDRLLIGWSRTLADAAGLEDAPDAIVRATARNQLEIILPRPVFSEDWQLTAVLNLIDHAGFIAQPHAPVITACTVRSERFAFAPVHELQKRLGQGFEVASCAFVVAGFIWPQETDNKRFTVTFKLACALSPEAQQLLAAQFTLMNELLEKTAFDHQKNPRRQPQAARAPYRHAAKISAKRVTLTVENAPTDPQLIFHVLQRILSWRYCNNFTYDEDIQVREETLG
ncbi:hypothetical protein L1281_000924 [Neisseria sp. HSC-16F19]|nr:hypothetical protein [Neisseria sp. HSC-16F19]